MSDELRIMAYGLSATGNPYNLDNMYVNGRYVTNATEDKSTVSKVTRADFQAYAVCDAGTGAQDPAGSAANTQMIFSGMQELQGVLENSGKIDKEKIWSYLASCNERIRKRNAELGQPDAKVSYAGLFLHGNRGLAVHVGDSRIYVIRGGRILQITEDHLECVDLYHKGIITQEQMDIHKKGSRLSAYLGIEDLENTDEEIFSKYFIFYPGDIFLLCTDGLSDTMRVGDLERLVRSLRGDEAVSNLMKILGQRVAEAKQGDSTIVMLNIEDTEGEQPVRGASTIPRKENYEKRDEKKEPEKTVLGRVQEREEPKSPSKSSTRNAERKDLSTTRSYGDPNALVQEEDEEYEEYEGGSLLDRLVQNPRMVAIVVCIIIIFILLMILIFRIADSNSSKNKVESQTSTESRIEQSIDSQIEESVEDSVAGQDSETSMVEDSEASDTTESTEDSQESEAQTTTADTYTVQSGDTLYSICINLYSRADNEIYKALAAYNGFEIDDPDDFVIYPDQVLKTPSLSELGLE